MCRTRIATIMTAYVERHCDLTPRTVLEVPNHPVFAVREEKNKKRIAGFRAREGRSSETRGVVKITNIVI